MSATRSHDPIATVTAALGAAGKVAKQGGGLVACCPAHEDHRHSLSIGTGKDGRALLTCHAGCTLEQIVGALGLEMTALFPPSEKRAPQAESMTDCYAYTDESGRVLYEVCRYHPKSFRQRVPQPGGGYSWKMEGVPRVWYRLPSLLQGLAQGKVVFICEGEKDANALAEIGLTATSLAGGAAFTSSKHWPGVAAEHFRGARVVLLPDNDEPGRAHMARVAERLTPIATWVRTVALPGLAEKGDVSDWLQAGGTVGDLKALVAASPTVPAGREATPVAHGDTPAVVERREAALPYMCTAFGNADRFVDAHDADVRYVAEWDQWHTWDGARWSADSARAVPEMAKAVIRNLMKESWSLDDPEQKKRMAQWAAKSQTASAVESILTLSSSDPRIVRSASQFDADPNVLNVANGVLDLRTGVLSPHDRALHHTKVVHVPFSPDAPCPRWEIYLRRVVPDAAVRTLLRVAVGYSLTGHTSEECLFLLWGTGKNGKSRFFDVLRGLSGDYGLAADFETFLEKPSNGGGGATEDLARLRGARVVCTSESSEGTRLNESLVKSLTGRDTIKARALYQSSFEFLPQFTIWMAANHRPVIRGSDDGIWRRMRLIPFTETIQPHEVEKDLPDALRAELPGILAWAVAGAIQWYREGLPSARAVDEATEAYRAESDALAPFLDECCEVGERLSAPRGELYAAYVSWCKENGERPLTQNVFGRKLTDRGFGATTNAITGAKQRSGIALRTPSTTEGPYGW